MRKLLFKLGIDWGGGPHFYMLWLGPITFVYESARIYYKYGFAVEWKGD